LIDVVKLG